MNMFGKPYEVQVRLPNLEPETISRHWRETRALAAQSKELAQQSPYVTIVVLKHGVVIQEDRGGSR